MYLTLTAEYALRAMSHVAARGEGAAVRAQDLTETTGIPLPYLSKILRRLVVGGLLTSQKGHGGGFVLSRPAKQISFGDILAAADFTPDPQACAFGWDNCDPVHPCPLHPAWAELKKSYSDWAVRTTLAHVLEQNTPARGKRARKEAASHAAQRTRTPVTKPRKARQA